MVHILQAMKYMEDQKYNHEMYPFPIPDFMNEIKTKTLCIFTKNAQENLLTSSILYVTVFVGNPRNEENDVI